MNQTLLRFCEIEQEALTIYSKSYIKKDDIYDLISKKYGQKYESVILLGIEAAAESWNFHGDSGPWLRDLKEITGFFTKEDLKSMRHYVKFN